MNSPLAATVACAVEAKVIRPIAHNSSVVVSNFINKNFFEIRCRGLVGAGIAVTAVERLWKPPVDGGRPEDETFLRGIIVKQLRCPAVAGLVGLTHRNRLLFRSVLEMRSVSVFS